MRRLLARAALLVGLTLAAAENGETQIAAATGQVPVLRLTVDEARRLALEHNSTLAVERLTPLIGDTEVAQASSAFAPTFTSIVQRNSQLAPPTSSLVGSQGVQTDLDSSNVGLSQRLRWGGGSYSVAWDSSRTRSDSLFSNFNPSLASRLQFTLAQPLLRDFAIDAARQQISVSRRNRQIDEVRLRETQEQTLADVERTYWDLVAARASVEVQQQSLDLALELTRVNQARVTVGQSPPVDLVAAQAEVAARREALIVAQTGARQAEDRLRTLVLAPDHPGFWDVRLELLETPATSGPPIDVRTATARALATRTDLERTRQEIANTQTNVRFFDNQRLPDLRVQASYLSNGVGGTQLLRTGGFPGTVVGTLDTGFGTVLDQVVSRVFPTWTVGFTLSYPLGASGEEAALARARLEQRQAQARLRDLELQAIRELREAAWNVEAGAERIEATRAARALSEERLVVEQRRFEAGLSTSFLVVQAQRDLAQARNNELAAALDHQRARIEFELVQKAAPGQSRSQRSTTAPATASSGSGGTPAAGAAATGQSPGGRF